VSKIRQESKGGGSEEYFYKAKIAAMAEQFLVDLIP
jgi:hypothetical protein